MSQRWLWYQFVGYLECALGELEDSDQRCGVLEILKDNHMNMMI